MLFLPDRLPSIESSGLPRWLAMMTLTRSAALGRCSGLSERQAVNSCAISAGHSSGILQAHYPSISCVYLNQSQERHNTPSESSAACTSSAEDMRAATSEPKICSTLPAACIRVQ